MTPAEQILKLLDEYPPTARAHRWYKRKPNGGKPRPITAPNDELKQWLQAMNRALSKQFNDWPGFMHGGILGRSYVSFARVHVGQPCVITIDVHDCFGSITEPEVQAALQQHLQLSPAACKRLAKLLCFKGKLAQGYPTSNYICNLYLLQPLAKLHRDLGTKGLALGNYVDDIAISGAIANPAGTINEAALTLSHARLKMNKAKVHVMPATVRQVVCGLVVNARLSLTKELKRRLLSDIAHGRMSTASARGWSAQLRTIDPVFHKKFCAYVLQKGEL